MIKFIQNIVIALVLVGASSTSHAWDKVAMPDISAQPLAVQVGVAALKGCMAQYLDKNTMDKLENNVINAIKNVQYYCKTGDENSAYVAVKRYSKRSEISAARKCVQQLKPMLDSPEIQNILGKHKSDVNIALSGGIPTPICR